MANYAFTLRNRRADYEQVRYRRDLETGRFVKQMELVDFPRLPLELRTETTREQRLISNGASQVITGRFRNKKREFFTGLRSTGFPLLFHGNDADKSEVLFHFSEDYQRLTVYYFRGWQCFPAERQAFYAEFMLHLRQSRMGS